jgi:hypothetical protein
VLADGGGTIYFPAGTYHFAIGGVGDRNIINIAGTAQAVANANLRLLGDGRATVLTWGGDAGGADAHFFNIHDGVSHVTVESLAIRQKNAIINPDREELHHFFSIFSRLYGPCEHIQFLNVHFGICKGDAINLRGGIDPGAVISGANGIAGTVPAGVVPTSFVQPLIPQRLVCTFPAARFTGKVDVNAAAGTFTRPTESGSYLSDGFAVGQTVIWNGFANAGNNTTKVITALTATEMRVENSGLVDESVDEGDEDDKRAVGLCWDGGNFTVTGTDVQDKVITETFTAVHNDAVIGRRIFKSVTRLEKSGSGICTLKATLGVACEIKHVRIQGCTFDGFVFAGTNPGYGYRSAIGAQRLTSYISVLDNYMTGADDQLIDFEPTGNGELGPWRISRNIIVANTPVSGHRPPGVAITLSGNGNTSAAGSLLNEYSVLSDNYIEGRIKGNKWDRVRVVNNHIYDVDNDHSVEGMLSSNGTNRDVDIIGNIIVCRTTTRGKPISIVQDSAFDPQGVRVCDNTIYWYGVGAAITVQGSGLDCSRNRLVFVGSTTDTINGIIVDPATVSGQLNSVCDNTFDGARGGGSLKCAITVHPGGVANAGLRVSGNKGRGVSGGLSIGAGTYSPLPLVYGNEFSGATTPISLGSGVVICVGGNPGSAAQYVSANTDPASNTELAELADAGIGSTHQSTGPGGNLHLKTASGSRGWKQVMHA